MRAFIHPMVAAMVIGAATVGGAGCALAGWDDGGSRSFFDESGPGSAAGAASRAQNPSSGTSDAATGSQPSSSVARTGVAQDEQRARHRPHVAVTHVGREPAGMRSTRMAGTATRPAHHATAARAHAGPMGTMHAMHRHPAGENGQS